MERVVIGRVRGAHGVRGEVKIETFDPVSRSIKNGMTLWVGAGESARAMKVSGVRSAHDHLLVRFDGIDDRNAAHAMLGRDVVVERSALPKLPVDEFYLSDVVGFTARTLAGEVVGIVEGVVDSPTPQPILVVRGADGGPRAGRELLVPCVEGIVVEVRAASRELVIDPPDGLLDL
jgi:16S rRNA processing protein RimM